MNTIVKKALKEFIDGEIGKAKMTLRQLAGNYGSTLIDKNNKLTTTGLNEAKQKLRPLLSF